MLHYSYVMLLMMLHYSYVMLLTMLHYSYVMLLTMLHYSYVMLTVGLINKKQSTIEIQMIFSPTNTDIFINKG